MQVADSRMIASVGSRMRRVVAVLDPDVAGGVHHNTTHRWISSTVRSVDRRSVLRATLQPTRSRARRGGVPDREVYRQGIPRRRRTVVPSMAWTTVPRSASS